jgi:thiol-disulfide isomerase/thioredoxin
VYSINRIFRHLLLCLSCLLLAQLPAFAGQQDTGQTASLFSSLKIVVPQKQTIMGEIVLPDLSGRIQAVRKQPGRIIFVTFWASWCPDCRREMPAMERLYIRYKDRGLAMVAINLMEPPETVRAFRDDFGLSFPLLMDQTGETARSFSLRSIPTTYLLDDKGVIVGQAQGSRDWDRDEAILLFDLLLRDGSQDSSSKPK